MFPLNVLHNLHLGEICPLLQIANESCLRQGEKLKEILITEDEKKKCLEKKDMWVLSPYNNQ
jgi:FlaA1/EpsC-like NDP-sugar epimerase